jgi:uncharacterized membrane protein YeaQ/YmgE (transglycosylase-associated protein family)
MFLTVFVILVLLFVVLPLIGMTAWALTSTIIVGLIIGVLGRVVVPRSQGLGFVNTLMAGLIGSIVGGFLGDHVLGLGWFATVLIEIGVAAAAVAILGASRRRQLRAARGHR